MTIEITSREGEPIRCTFAEFCADNAFEGGGKHHGILLGLGSERYRFTELECEVMRGQLEAGRLVEIGGGAWAAFTLRCVAPAYRPRKLSKNQVAVWGSLAQGYSSRETAFALNLSLSTVRSYRREISRRLNLHGVVELVREAIAQGVISVPPKPPAY